jgi:hypothetical protein
VGQTVPVYVYTNGDEAELFLNGTSLGRRSKAKEVIENPNLAIGKPATASSTKTGAENSAGNATDGNNATSWAASGTRNNAWWQVDLGEMQELKYITVSAAMPPRGRPGGQQGQMFGGFRNAGPSMQYTVRVSEDGKAWRDVMVTAPDMAARRYQPSYTVEGVARFVRVVFTDTAGQTPGIREVGIYRYNIDEAYYFMTRHYRLMWEDVVYAPGELKAVAYKNGQQIGEAVVKTAGYPAKIRLTPDRTTIDATGEDLSFVTVEVLDKDGVFCPLADNLITFALDGPGEIAGVDNGNPISFMPFQANEMRLFNGKAMLVVRSKEDKRGSIRIKASAEGVDAGTVTVSSK